MAFRRVSINCVKNLLEMTNEIKVRAIHTERPHMKGNDGSSKTNGPCDPGICPREQLDIKQFLDRKEAEYLQPSRTNLKITTFEVSRPHVEKYIVPELEENCLQKKRCDDLKKGKSSEEGEK